MGKQTGIGYAYKKQPFFYR